MIFPKLHIGLERWKWNKEYGLYVSNFGNIKKKNKQDSKIKTNISGYLTVKSYLADKYVLVHRLVMMTWKPIAGMDKMTVDHLDHNKRNNKLSNLEWVTEEENQRRAAEDHIGKEKAPKIKFIVTNYTLDHFYLCCDGLYFTEQKDVVNYMKTQNANIDISQYYISVDKIFQTLLNAYNHQDPHYVNKGFTKKVFNCELSIIKKG